MRDYLSKEVKAIPDTEAEGSYGKIYLASSGTYVTGSGCGNVYFDGSGKCEYGTGYGDGSGSDTGKGSCDCYAFYEEDKILKGKRQLNSIRFILES